MFILGSFSESEDYKRQQKEVAERMEKIKQEFFDEIRRAGEEPFENEILARFLSKGCTEREKREFKGRLDQYLKEMQGHNCVMEARIIRQALEDLNSGNYRSSRINRYERFLDETVLDPRIIWDANFSGQEGYPPNAGDIQLDKVFKRYPWIKEFGETHEFGFLVLTEGDYTARQFRGYIELPAKNVLVKKIKSFDSREKFILRAALKRYSHSASMEESSVVNTTARSLELGEYQFPFFKRYEGLLDLVG